MAANYHHDDYYITTISVKALNMHKRHKYCANQTFDNSQMRKPLSSRLQFKHARHKLT